MVWRLGRYAIYFVYGLDVEIWPKSGVPHHPPELFIQPWWGNRYFIKAKLQMEMQTTKLLMCLCRDLCTHVGHSAVKGKRYLFPNQGWIAARSAYWTTKENSESE